MGTSSLEESDSKLALCKNMNYEKFDPGEIILIENDPSNNKLYIILSGTVSVVKKNF